VRGRHGRGERHYQQVRDGFCLRVVVQDLHSRKLQLQVTFFSSTSKGGNMRSKVALSVISGIALAFGGAAHAKDSTKQLVGEYMVIGFGSCITAPPGASFNPVTFAAPAGSTVFTFTVRGTRVFNGDGTGQDSGVSVSINQPTATGFTGGAGSTSFSGQFTYTVDEALNITMVQAPFYSTTLTGSPVGTTALISNVPNFSGRVSEDLSTVTVQHESPGIETVTGPGPTGAIITRQRICLRERTATKVRRGRQDD
jgi:hypothetical protein